MLKLPFKIILAISIMFLFAGCSEAEEKNAAYDNSVSTSDIQALKISSFPETIDRNCRNGRAKLFDECASQVELYNTAKKQAEGEGKTLLVSYGAEWCIWCHVFEAYIKGETNKFEYTYGEPGKKRRYTDTMYERAKRDVSQEAYNLRKYVSDNFVVVHIDYEHSPDGKDVLAKTKADEHYDGGLPFIYTVDKSGTFAAKFVAKNAETRRDTDDWYRGYDRTRLIAELKNMRARAGQDTHAVEGTTQAQNLQNTPSTKPVTVSSASSQLDTSPTNTESKTEQSLAASNVTKQAILVLDASGSMWGKVDDKHKIEIARDVVERTLTNWDSDIEMGLMAYGHRRKGDCSDIELLLPPKRLDAAAIIKKAKGLNPTGKTPLSAAVTKAAEILDYKNTKATVILVSDGKETCDLDPCAVGEALEAAGLDFTAHIIGFDVPKEETIGMQCLAENTGGVFIEAKDSAELEEALADTTEVMSEETNLDLSPATLDFESPVVAGKRFPVAWTGPENKKDVITIYTPEREAGGFDIEHLSIHDFETPITLTAPETVGNYLVVYKAPNGQILGEKPLEVVKALATIDAPKSVIAGSRFEVKWTGPKNQWDQIVLRASEENTKQLSDAYVDSDDKPNPAKLTAPDDAGDYQLVLQTYKRNILASRKITVTPAAATLKIAQEEIIAGNRIEVEWRGPGNEYDEIVVYNMDGTKYSIGEFTPNRTRKHIKQDEGQLEIDVPEIAGNYLVVYRTAKDEKVLASAEIKVEKAAGWIKLPASATPGKNFELKWGGPENRNDRLAIFDVNGKQHHGGFANKNAADKVRRGRPAKLIAPEEPGQYIVKLLTGEKRELASAKLIVK